MYSCVAGQVSSCPAHGGVCYIQKHTKLCFLVEQRHSQLQDWSLLVVAGTRLLAAGKELSCYYCKERVLSLLQERVLSLLKKETVVTVEEEFCYCQRKSLSRHCGYRKLLSLL